MLVSGSLPMSSAEMASTMEFESCLMPMALSIAARIPVTVTVSTFSGDSSAVGAAVAAGPSAAVAGPSAAKTGVAANSRHTNP
jgi:hypothetical protein